MGLLDGKQIRDTSTSLDKLNGSGLVTFTASATMSFASGTFLRRETSDILVGNDVVNKEYVDAVAVGLNPKEAARVIYVGDVTAEFGYTYSNGVSGVGATLSFSFSAIDGINSASFSAGDRIVVNSTTDRWVNGIYDYTTTNLLTRSTDFDGDPSAEVDGGEYCFIKEGNSYADQGWVVSSPDTTAIIGTTPIVWVQFTSLGGSFNLSVADYNTGMTYSNVENIIFRGGVITKPASPGTASAVLVTQDTPVTVTVWIPQPDYVGYFSPSLNTAATSRYIATPTSNTYSSTPGNTGSYATGTWVPSTDFTGSTTRPVVGNATSTISSAFNEAEFACYDLSTTLQFQLFDSDGSEIRGMTISLTGTGTFNSTPSGLSINVSSFLPDSDRYKAAASGSINLSTIFPNGGKYVGWKITHYNSGYGPGAGSPLVPGEYTFSTLTGYFWDNDLSPSSANLSGSVVFDESTPTLVYYSGVAFYDSGSTFALTASGVDLLNDITFPSSKQIDFSTTNMSTTGTLDGHSDGTKAAGTAITGWNLEWDKSGLTYSRTSTVNATGYWIPGFSTNNTISSSGVSRVTSTLYDWASVASYNSGYKAMLFDTVNSASKSYFNDPLESETGRLLTGSVLTTNGSAAFVSNVTLPSDELQYIFGRVIYPQTNFQNFFPLINQTNSVNYSSLSGSNKTFNIYDNIGSGAGTTTPLVFNGYRWHVTSYGANSGFSSDISTGRFKFNPSNFLEAYLDRNTQTSSAGTQDLVILAGFDSSGSNSLPDKFLFLSGNAATYPGRSTANLYYLGSGASDPYTIAYNRQSLSFTCRKVWLFVGIADGSTIGTAASKNLYMSEITFVTPS